ncbi:hypothetical protein ASD21_10195 [Caulobacter sp. Root1455]|uniref:type II toxin-antitoxin system VapC family toxin n=1 Tax=unclassified Caulobacter TaxID=2648921 RepID=UPI00070119B7|nr:MULTISPECIES: type II toxin-antitoxin system VapC family toxin [unclassified Caulobacter]KQY27589.1 hypothetical protein ASD38_16925 [Caulobacter sp. Root487D2Y]KQY93945.1 hypothetical protein ASD21_10195 [Caulobacter sp. Root1455]
MSFLLDTHALIWWMIDPRRLSSKARACVEGRDHPLFVSAASAYEIEYKRDRDLSLYRLPPALPRVVPRLGVEWLPIDVDDGFQAARLEKSHKDPWDRIIAAQAARRNLSLITSDGPLTEACLNWRVQTVW